MKAPNSKPPEILVGKLLLKKNLTLAIAESCTGGLIADKITNVPKSSKYFKFSAVTYCNEMKNKILGIAKKTLENHGAVSEQTAKEMAENVCRIAKTDFGLAISGIAGPAGGTKKTPAGTVYIGIATKNQTEIIKMYFPKQNRLARKEIFAATALEILLEKIATI